MHPRNNRVRPATSATFPCPASRKMRAPNHATSIDFNAAHCAGGRDANSQLGSAKALQNVLGVDRNRRLALDVELGLTELWLPHEPRIG